MKIRAIEIFSVRLPFRFSFGHALAERNQSFNLIVKVEAEGKDGSSASGWGESIPRDYVTGEDLNQALDSARQIYAPRFLGMEYESTDALIFSIKQVFRSLGLTHTCAGAAWCALELALLDGAARSERRSVASYFGGPGKECLNDGIVYGGVIPFSKTRSLQLLLWIYKLAGFRTVKLKVGNDLEADLQRLKLARDILGSQVKIRLDANCAWSVDDTIRFCEKAKALNIASIEQPLPANDYDGLAYLVNAIDRPIIVDESLCTLEQARRLAEAKLCHGFNIRLSKVGGYLAALEMANIAKAHGISCHLGAQVGESGILTAAGRSLASVMQPCENYEGSANFFLLKQDLVKENLTFGLAGKAKVLNGPGFGICVETDKVERLSSGTSFSLTEPAKAEVVSR